MSGTEFEPDSSNGDVEDTLSTFHFPGLEQKEKQLFLKALEDVSATFTWQKKGQKSVIIVKGKSYADYYAYLKQHTGYIREEAVCDKRKRNPPLKLDPSIDIKMRSRKAKNTKKKKSSKWNWI